MSIAAFDFDFVVREPGPPLGRFVESIWYARGTVPYDRERIAPTGSTVAVFVLGDPIVQIPDDGAGRPLRAERGFLIGPHDRPVINQPTGETFAVGIVTTPIGCEAIFGLRPAPLRGRVLDLVEAWAPAAVLREALLAQPDAEAMLDVIEAHLAAGPPTSVGGLDRCGEAVAMLERDPTRAIADIADALGVSHGHLVRECTRIVGLTPRSIARLLRMRRLLARVDPRGPVPWADLASKLGWYDQAHLVRDFKRHTGVTPSRYLAAQRANFPDTDPNDVGFVPEG